MPTSPRDYNVLSRSYLDLSTGSKTVYAVRNASNSIEFENDSDYVRRMSAYNSSFGAIPEFDNLEGLPRLADHHPVYDGFNTPTSQLGIVTVATTDINDGSTVSLRHIPTVDPEGNNVRDTYTSVIGSPRSGIYVP